MQPFAAAKVHIARNLGGTPIMLQTTADGDGYFFLDGTAFRQHTDFEIGAKNYRIMLEGYSSHCAQQWLPPTNPPQQLSIQATGSQRVQVKATWLHNQTPVTETIVHASLIKGDGFSVATTDKKGTAIFYLPAASKWDFLSYGNGSGFGHSEPFDSSTNKQDVQFALHPYAKRVQVTAIGEDTSAPLLQAQFISRHSDDEVLAYHEDLVAIPQTLPSKHGHLDFELAQQSPVYLLIEAEGYQPAAIGIFSATEDPIQVVLAPLKPRSIQVVENGRPVHAKLQYEVRAKQYRFGQYSHTTNRPADLFELSTDESGFATLMLPDEVKYYGYNLRITVENQRTFSFTKLQAKDHPIGTWVIDLAENVDLATEKPGK
jgi:hypothetical protein